MNLHRQFEIAKAASLFSNARHSRRVGAALFAGSRLLSLGFNSYGTTHPAAKPQCNLHAEHRALIRRQHYSNPGRLNIWVYRENAHGVPSCSRPCENCLELLREAGVSSVHFVNLENHPEKITL